MSVNDFVHVHTSRRALGTERESFPCHFPSAHRDGLPLTSRGPGVMAFAGSPISSVGPMTRPCGAAVCGGGGLASSIAEGQGLAHFAPKRRRGSKGRHVIADIHYGVNGGASYLDCTCAASLSASSPADLAALWRAHGGQVMTGFTVQTDGGIIEGTLHR